MPQLLLHGAASSTSEAHGTVVDKWMAGRMGNMVRSPG